ncbi:MAG TPA: hypothetical protein VMH02_13080 [Verrucomicrobiae bacterium]|nr:hypothetical protein [Verrucomicrobiae bacterium]
MTARIARPWGRIALQTLLAGIAGGALLDAFLWFVLVRPAGAGIAALWQTVAVQALGKSIAGDPNAAAYGLAIHAVVSLVWAGAYAYVAASRPTFNARWVVAGIVYGLVVYLFMQIVLLVSGNFEYPHSPNDFIAAVVAHVVFFGLPVALVVKLLARA